MREKCVCVCVCVCVYVWMCIYIHWTGMAYGVALVSRID